uniref:Putative secreted peptide n=1 Tax=Anopheles braziliensis TaxID=58242 RepID=A0A2M3ZP60_9DIPT
MLFFFSFSWRCSALMAAFFLLSYTGYSSSCSSSLLGPSMSTMGGCCTGCAVHVVTGTTLVSSRSSPPPVV